MVRVSQAARLRLLTLHRPDRRNAINDELREALFECLVEAEADDGVRGVILTGSGSAFCAGGDIKAMAERLSAPVQDVAEAGWRRQRRTHRLIRKLHDLDKPTVAAVNGHATGLGADLALSCDFVVASSAARIAMSYTARGLVPDGGAAYYLPRRIGLAKAKDLIFSGREVGPEEALALGLVDAVVDPEELLTAATEFLTQQTQNSPLAVSLSKELLNRSLESDMNAMFASTSSAQAMCYTSSEHRKAIEQFLSQRSRSSLSS
ncbi:enoyl-CoA hydratase/isomerase family protein [Streptomyces sp. SID8361]|nr:enoyl-CoA hydratase/isomerase family protein [Streptomyces sp. SID8361]